MNVSNAASNVNFGKIYVNDGGMNKTVRGRVDKVLDCLEYEPSIDKLDKMGVDVLISARNFDGEQGAQIVFSDAEYKNYKMNKQGFISMRKPDTRDKTPARAEEYLVGSVAEQIVDTAKNITDGTLTEKTKKASPKMKKLFPIRDNVLDRQDYPSLHALNFDEEETILSDEYKEIEEAYGRLLDYQI